PPAHLASALLALIRRRLLALVLLLHLRSRRLAPDELREGRHPRAALHAVTRKLVVSLQHLSVCHVFLLQRILIMPADHLRSAFFTSGVGAGPRSSGGAGFGGSGGPTVPPEAELVAKAETGA